MQPAHQHHQAALTRPRCLAPQTQRRDLLEKPTQIILKNHHQQNHQNCEKTLEYPRRQLQLELPRHQIEGTQKGQADKRHARVYAASPGDQPPQQQTNNGDVYKISRCDI